MSERPFELESVNSPKVSLAETYTTNGSSETAAPLVSIIFVKGATKYVPKRQIIITIIESILPIRLKIVPLVANIIVIKKNIPRTTPRPIVSGIVKMLIVTSLIIKKTEVTNCNIDNIIPNIVLTLFGFFFFPESE